jgi:hypothetical protein
MSSETEGRGAAFVASVFTSIRVGDRARVAQRRAESDATAAGRGTHRSGYSVAEEARIRARSAHVRTVVMANGHKAMYRYSKRHILYGLVGRLYLVSRAITPCPIWRNGN